MEPVDKAQASQRRRIVGIVILLAISLVVVYLCVNWIRPYLTYFNYRMHRQPQLARDLTNNRNLWESNDIDHYLIEVKSFRDHAFASLICPSATLEIKDGEVIEASTVSFDGTPVEEPWDYDTCRYYYEAMTVDGLFDTASQRITPQSFFTYDVEVQYDDHLGYIRFLDTKLKDYPSGATVLQGNWFLEVHVTKLEVLD